MGGRSHRRAGLRPPGICGFPPCRKHEPSPEKEVLRGDTVTRLHLTPRPAQFPPPPQPGKEGESGRRTSNPQPILSPARKAPKLPGCLPPPSLAEGFPEEPDSLLSTPNMRGVAGSHLSASLLGQDKSVTLCLTPRPESLSPLLSASSLAFFFARCYLPLQNEQSNKLLTQGRHPT